VDHVQELNVLERKMENAKEFVLEDVEDFTAQEDLQEDTERKIAKNIK